MRYLDHWLNWLAEKKVTGLILLGGSAEWMFKGGKTEPADWEYFTEVWSDHAAQVVRHVNVDRRAGIKYWEVWNEPDGPSFWFGRPWGGEPERYAKIYLACVRKMKAVDPTIQIGTGGIA